MTAFATLSARERRLTLDEAAARLGLLPVIAEKDFWVCWTLDRIFRAGALAPHVVFKGGTSLSKVFGAIERFSEDVDLSIAPGRMGFAEQALDDAPSASQRRKQFQSLAEACTAYVEHQFQPVLEAAISTLLGSAPKRSSWLHFEMDAVAGTPNLLFAYPSVLDQPGGYIQSTVKLEIGSLTDQRPAGTHPISALLAQVMSGAFDDLSANVVALAIERSFWEKATILHAEYHRPAEQPLRDRFSRHYADFAALWSHPSRAGALARLDLLADVVRHKSRFFASGWASYETARLGSFRLVPPRERIPELNRDYDRMRPMFLSEPPTFDAMRARLDDAERKLNAT